jgi:very-short-patch-repair endonuclease
MGTTMNEITTKLINRQKEEMQLFLGGLYDAGYSAREIAAKIKTQVEIKEREFYAKKEAKKIEISSFIGTSLEMIKDKVSMSGDSKAERIFYKILEDNNIRFNFQYPIGKYKVDFLIAGAIVFEGDGKQHRKSKAYDTQRDKYLGEMGYHVMRLEWSVVAMSPSAVIDEIKLKIKELGL